MESNTDLMTTDLFDRVVRPQGVPIDRDAGLGVDGFDNVCRGHGPEELALASGARSDHDGRRDEALSDRFGRLPITSVLEVARPTHRCRLIRDAVGRDDRLPGRDEVIAGVPIGNVNDVAALS